LEGEMRVMIGPKDKENMEGQEISDFGGGSQKQKERKIREKEKLHDHVNQKIKIKIKTTSFKHDR
jgi:hypothetical protein